MGRAAKQLKKNKQGEVCSMPGPPYIKISAVEFELRTNGEKFVRESPSVRKGFVDLIQNGAVIAAYKQNSNGIAYYRIGDA